MSTPETSLSTKLYNAATLSNFGTLASIGFSIYGAVEDQKNWAGVNRKLDDLLKGQELIKQRIDNVYAEVQDSKLLTSTIGFENAIDGWFRSYQALVRRAANPEENLDRLKDDTKELVSKLEECDDYLREIDAAFMGTLSSLGKSYMDFYVNEVMHLGARMPRTQSDYFYALSRFERWLIIQQKGVLLLGNLYKYKDPQASTTKIIKDLRHATHGTDENGVKVSKQKIQATHSASFLKDVDRYYKVFNAGGNEDSDFICFGLNSCDAADICYLDTNPVVSDPGKIVVGLQFYRKFDWLAIKIIQAAFSNGFVDQNKPKPKANDHTDGSGVAELINKERLKELVKQNGRRYKKDTENQILKRQQIYIDLSSAEAPSREIMTGAKLYLRGNWICIAIQAAKLSDGLTHIDESTRHWIDAPGPQGKGEEDRDFFTIRGTCKYINIHPLTPTPLAPLRGAKFLRHATGDDHRMNLSVKTGLCDIEDLWEKYDLSTLTLSGSSLLLADGYKGRVRLKDSQGLCVDNIGWASKNDFVFDLVHAQSGKIHFAFGADGRRLGLDKDGGLSVANGAASEFEWLPMGNGSVALMGNNGKFLGRRTDREYAFFVADQSELTAERFQIIKA